MPTGESFGHKGDVREEALGTGERFDSLDELRVAEILLLPKLPHFAGAVRVAGAVVVAHLEPLVAQTLVQVVSSDRHGRGLCVRLLRLFAEVEKTANNSSQTQEPNTSHR